MEQDRWTSNCPSCHAQYSPVEARVVAEKEGGYMLFHECNGCKSTVVSALVEEEGGVTGIGLVTDMTYYDASRFRDGQSVTPDHVLDAYVSLKNMVKPRVLVADERTAR